MTVHPAVPEAALPEWSLEDLYSGRDDPRVRADLEAAARAAAPRSAYVRGELLEGPAPAWDAMVLRAARSIAIAAEPQGIGMCG